MGTVYEAVTTAGEKVAIKVLHTRYICITEVIKRFHRESRLAAAIGHVHICEVIDAGTDANGIPYLVMPLLDGCPLSALTKSETPLTWERLQTIVCQTLSALSAAHQAGVVHRDLKPDNIFITSRNGEDFVKLLDFGVSKVASPQPGSVYTKEGAIIGTPHYMAPEQAKSAKNIDHRADIYAVGVILYELMTGKRPFVGGNANETIFKIIAEPFLSPRRLNPTISKTVEQVILKAMARDPAFRFSSALEMRQAIKSVDHTPSMPPSRETSVPTEISHSGVPFDALNTTSKSINTRIAFIVFAALTAVAIAGTLFFLIS